MDMNEYQGHTASTAIYPNKSTGSPEAISYCIFGLVGKAGEIANKWKKFFRDNEIASLSAESREAVLQRFKAELGVELGDVLWYVSQLAWELNYTLDGLASENMDKLASRKERGKLTGSGDYR